MNKTILQVGAGLFALMTVTNIFLGHGVDQLILILNIWLVGALLYKD